MLRPPGLSRFLAVAVAVALFALTGSGGGDGGSAGAVETFAPVARGAVEAAVSGQPAAGLKWDWDGVEGYGPYLESFGGGDTFYELVWCDVEPDQGRRDWSRIDDVVQGAASYGFRMHLKIRVGSCWATGKRLAERGEKRKTASLLPTDLDAYRDFVRAVVARYAPQGVHRYAVENEVNLTGFWQSSASDYERLVRAAAVEIHDADPEALVLDAGMSSTAAGAGIARWLLEEGRGDEALAAYRRYYQRRFEARRHQMPEVDDVEELDDALRSGAAARSVEFLDATFRLAADGVIGAYQLHFYERWDNLPLLLDFLRRRLPPGFPIESWETGIFWPGASGHEAELAAEVAKTTSLLLAGGVRPVIWLPAAADMKKGRELRWGLFDAEGGPRLAADVFLDLAQAATDSAAVPLTGGALEGVALTRDGRTYVMMWSNTGTRLDGGRPAGTTARHVDGRPAEWGPAGLRVDQTPVVLEMAGSVETALELVR